MTEASSGWARLRALLIAVVLLWSFFDAVPLPEVRKYNFRYALAQDELARWRGILGYLGVEVTKDELMDLALDVGAKSIKTRRLILTPYTPIRGFLGTGQDWGLFAYPDPYAGRLVVSGRHEDGTWAQLYAVPDDGGGRVGSLLRYRRVRGVFDDAGDRPRPSKLHDRFCAWLASEVYAEYPDLNLVEIRIDSLEIKLPGQGSPPPEEPLHVRVVTRDGAVGKGNLALEEAKNEKPTVEAPAAP